MEPIKMCVTCVSRRCGTIIHPYQAILVVNQPDCPCRTQESQPDPPTKSFNIKLTDIL